MPSVPLIRSSALAPAGGFESPLPALVHLLAWPFRVARARGELAKLARLDDRELRDIGLTRHDIRGATALPLDQDPTRFLAALVGRRRGAWRP